MHCKEFKTKSGATRWYCMADGPRLPDGTRNQIQRRGKSQREAKRRVRAEIEKQMNTGIDSNLLKRMTFDKVANEWLKVYAASGAKRGSVRVREKEINILNKEFNGVPISNIDHFSYQNMLFDLDKKEYAYNTISGVNTCANMIFKYAKRNRLITDNPREDAIVPKKSITVEELENDSVEELYFESSELDQFMDMVLSIGLELDKERFYLLAFGGMRPGELCALKKSDLNFEDNTIRISKTLYSENNNMRDYTLDTTKTKTMRVVEMDEDIMKLLKKLVHKNDVHKMKNRTLLDEYHDEDYVFQRPNGYPYITKNIATRMKRLLKFTDIKKHLTPHSFRHTHVSMLTESGAELSSIMERVGHADPNTTLKVYTHVTKKMKVRTTQKLTNYNKEIIDKIAEEK